MSVSVIDEDRVERIYRDAEDLFVSMKLRKRRKISLDEVIAEIGAHIVDDSDPTEIVREMRDRFYGYQRDGKSSGSTQTEEARWAL